MAIGAAATVAVVAAGSAIYSTIELAELSSKMYATQEVNVQILQDHETRLAVNTRSISLINSTVSKIGLKLVNMANFISIDEVILHVAFTMNAAFDDVNRVIRGLNALAEHRLSPDSVKTDSMAKALTKLRS
jgi:hypothetical protein